MVKFFSNSRRRMKKGCELCKNYANIYCESDQASLCWGCDSRVHGANFLVAKHCRILLCHSCQGPTPWNGSGPKLGPAITICENCVRKSDPVEVRARYGGVCGGPDHDEDNNDGGGGGEEEEEEDSGDSGSSSGGGNDDDEENQVVPSSSSSTPPPPPPIVSSSSEESSNHSYVRTRNYSAKRRKLMGTHQHHSTVTR